MSGTVYFDINKKESAPTGNSLKVGENVCTVAEGEFDNSLFGKVYTFTAPEAGTYNFSTNDGNCFCGIETSGGVAETLQKGTDIKVTLAENEVVTVVVGFNDWNQTSGTVTFSITKA